MKIEYATPSLLDEIVSIERQCFSCPWSENSFKEAFSSEHTVVYAARDDDGTLCGFSCMMSVGEEAEILNIAVSPAYRRHGIGLALMDAMLLDANAKHVTQIFLEVRSQNAPAISLYESKGFMKIGLRKRYYTRPVDDAILMALDLSDNS